MGLIKVWKERQKISPHRPKRARTPWLVLGLAAVLLLIWLLERV